MLFQTSRLIIRPLQLSDLLPYQKLQGNPNVMLYTGTPVQNAEESKKDLARLIGLYEKPNNDFWIWAIVLKDNNHLVGTCALILEEEKKGEIGYRFLEKYWGNGYASEIVEPLIDYGFSTMKLQTVFATVDVLNIASLKMLDKSQLNFIKEYWNEELQCTDRYYEKSI